VAITPSQKGGGGVSPKAAAITVSTYEGLAITYNPEIRRFEAEFPNDGPELDAATEGELREKIDRAKKTSERRPKVGLAAILVRRHAAPIVGTFRGFHGRLGTLLFSDHTGKAVETDKYEDRNAHILKPDTACADLAALASEIVDLEKKLHTARQGHAKILERLENQKRATHLTYTYGSGDRIVSEEERIAKFLGGKP
jgi:hypothetical protein